MIRENQGLVYSIAKKFAVAHPLEDLMQEGNIGLMKAAEKFDPARGKWANYAAWWIRAYLMRFVKHQTVVHRAINKRGGPPADVSLDAAGSDDEPSMLDRLMSVDELADDALATHQLRQNVRDALDRIGPRLNDLGRAIVEQRLMRADGLTLEEVGSQFGVSRERVRQVELRTRELLARYLAPIQAEHAT